MTRINGPCSGGLKDLRLWHNADDRNDIFLLFEAADVAKAKALLPRPI